MSGSSLYASFVYNCMFAVPSTLLCGWARGSSLFDLREMDGWSRGAARYSNLLAGFLLKEGNCCTGVMDSYGT